jgi:hypothetical protein
MLPDDIDDKTEILCLKYHVQASWEFKWISPGWRNMMLSRPFAELDITVPSVSGSTAVRRAGPRNWRIRPANTLLCFEGPAVGISKSSMEFAESQWRSNHGPFGALRRRLHHVASSPSRCRVSLKGSGPKCVLPFVKRVQKEARSGLKCAASRQESKLACHAAKLLWQRTLTKEEWLSVDGC